MQWSAQAVQETSAAKLSSPLTTSRFITSQHILDVAPSTGQLLITFNRDSVLCKNECSVSEAC
jgi:hypothetical protein